MAYFNLEIKEDRDLFKKRCNFLFEKRAKVELVQKREQRTLKQNAYLHVIFGVFAIETGYTIQEVKQDVWKCHVCRDIFMVEKNGILVTRSSTDLNTLEMTNAIERFKNWAASEFNILLPSPEDKDDLRSLYENLKRYGNNQYL